MKYKLNYAKKSEFFLRKLERIRINPESFLIKLIGNKLYKLKIGKFRLYIDLKKEEMVVLVIKIGHRKNIYK